MFIFPALGTRVPVSGMPTFKPGKATGHCLGQGPGSPGEDEAMVTGQEERAT
jgi:hypothetical protein